VYEKLWGCDHAAMTVVGLPASLAPNPGCAGLRKKMRLLFSLHLLLLVETFADDDADRGFGDSEKPQLVRPQQVALPE
jgi:hypothetical protein